ncbi:MAG TPA: 40S ribosomal protein S19, partial [Methanosarcina sp.]|nr:40S ribosomal protein S19 [Methanosarcina sp.]
MTTVFDVPAMEMIEKLAGILKENEKIVPPEWAKNVKTGV